MISLAKKDLPNDVETLRNLALSMHDDMRRMSREIERLREQLQQMIDHRFGRKTERVDPNQLLLFAGSKPRDTEVEKEEIVVPRHRRRKHRGHGREPFPEHLPRNRIDCDPPEEERTCSCCGKPLIRIGEEISERGHMIPPRLIVNQYVRGKFACPDGHDGVRIAELPPALIDKAKYETSMYAHLVCAKYADHMPLHRMNGIFKRFGLNVSKSLMWEMVLRSAELLEPVVKQMKTEILQAKYIGADETPITVLIPGKKGSETGYIWTYLTRVGRKVRPVFDFTINRSRAGPNRFLGEWKGGHLQVDQYSGYNELANRPDIVRVGCWAHVRRKFKEALGGAPKRAAQMLLLMRRLYRIESALKKRRDAARLDDEAFFELRKDVRDRLSRVMLKRIQGLADEFIAAGDILPRSGIGKAVDYMLNGWKTLEVFLDHGELEADNNDVERAIRHVAIGRKNWMFTGSEKGGRTACTLFSIVASCKALEIDPEAYLRDVLEAVAVTPASEAASLTPWAWAERHDALPAAD